jgi:hypothetical protein
MVLPHISPAIVEARQRITELERENAKLREALAPLVAIAEAYHASNLDEHRPEWGFKEPATVELFSGRGGKQLLTLADCLKAADAVR